MIVTLVIAFRDVNYWSTRLQVWTQLRER